MQTNEIATKADLQQLKVQIEAMLKETINQTNGPVKKWMRNADMKKIFGLSSSGLSTLRANGTLPYTKLHGTIYYDRAKIEKVLQSNEKN